MNRTMFLLPLLAALLARPARASDTIVYAEEDGTQKTAQVVSVSKDNPKEVVARILVQGKARKITLPVRRVVSMRRGDPDSTNQWSKRIATGKRYLATGRLATKGTEPGAEEILGKVAYSTEKGIKGEEAAYKVLPWHNMYACFYLIECRYKMGGEKLTAALKAVDEFRKRSRGKSGRKIDWEVPGEGGAQKRQVYTWGANRLETQVTLWEARIHAALKDGQAGAIYDKLTDGLKRGNGSPLLLATAIAEKAALDAEGKPSDQQETVYRAAGATMSSLARTQRDQYGKMVLGQAANRALLLGADLLLQSAKEGTVSYDLPLNRYRELKRGAENDPEMDMGAQTGIGICLAEKGEGEQSYKALLEVVVSGRAAPKQMAAALFYLGKAAAKFAEEIDSGGGSGNFLRAESKRWWDDLKQRYPSSNWAKQAQ